MIICALYKQNDVIEERVKCMNMNRHAIVFHNNHVVSFFYLLSHGTKCAGEVAAEAGNDICGVGVAFNSSIAGRWLSTSYFPVIVHRNLFTCSNVSLSVEHLNFRSHNYTLCSS